MYVVTEYLRVLRIYYCRCFKKNGEEELWLFESWWFYFIAKQEKVRLVRWC